MKFTSINIQGNLISEEVLQKVADATAENQKLATDFRFEQNTNLRDEIEYAWSRVKLDWKHFTEKASQLPSSDPYGTSLARKWIEQFFSSLGYDLEKHRSNLKGDNNQEYSISHTSRTNDGLPVSVVGFFDPTHPEKNTLDIKSSGGTSRLSPHGTVQEYLNVTGHVYGFASNGFFLRLIRDSGRLVKLSYIEFDLKRLLDEDKYSEFTVLFRLIHSSRFPSKKEDVAHAPIEKYYRESIETGNRIRNGLSRAVKEAMDALGKGFLRHPDNKVLLQKFRNKELSPKQYYDQLRRLVYRLLFLMVTEERDLIYDPEDKTEDTTKKKRIYLKHYSIARLRKLSQNRYLYESQFSDIWQGLVNTFNLFEDGGNGKKLNIQPLAGDLFSYSALKDINSCTISNNLLLECLRNLNEFVDEDSKALVPINYRALDVEELGSVYEGLLELHPVIEHLDSTNLNQINFTFHEGTERKTTGSYYTRPDLVNELIKSALIPVIEERLKEAGTDKEKRIKALLKLKVCDAAAGSGHMILAAARTIAWYLAVTDTGEDNPPPSNYRYWLREAIQHCIYGVDMNPDAVELCKLALWLEAHNSGKPLSFFDHKVRNGNSLVGVTDLNVLREPLPDEAFNPVTGDDKAACQQLKRANAAYRRTRQANLFSTAGQQLESEQKELNSAYAEIENIRQDDVEAVKKIKSRFEKARTSIFHQENACHIWTAAFFKTYTSVDDPTNPTSEKIAQYFHAPTQYGRLVGEAIKLHQQIKFFHWPLEFPDVFEQGGFDVMLGNPPWERIKLQQQEFFATRDASVANAANAAARNRLINSLQQNNPQLYNEFQSALHVSDATGKFLRESGRYKLTAVGDINTYPVFSELTSTMINKKGKTAIIVPTGIATDDSNKAFFGNLVEGNKFVSLFDFENKEAIFPSVHRSYKFCLLTIAGADIGNQKSQFGFFLTRVENLQDKLRVFSLSKEDFLRLNPNTKTCPVFRTSVDAELTTEIYKRVPVLINETTGENPWGVSFMRMFDMSNDSHLFRTREQLEDAGFRLWGNRMKKGEELWLPLYEAKYCWLYDHKFETNSSEPIDYANPSSTVIPRYWVNESNYLLESNWMLIQRAIADMGNERRMIFSIVPKAGVGNSGIISIFEGGGLIKPLLYKSIGNSIISDYLIRVKAQNPNLNQFVLKQLAVLPEDLINVKKVLIRILELTYTSWDMRNLADDIWKEADEELKVAIQEQWEANQAETGGHSFNPPEWCEIDPEGCPLPPFKWDENRRAVLKAELDAIYAKLYGLSTEELRYILDPQDVYGPDFPGETFRVLKEKEIRQYGEYRTKRLVLEAWERLNAETIINNEILIQAKVDYMKEFSLHEGIYSIKDTAEITGLSKEKIKRWFAELSKEQYEGLDYKQQSDVDHMRISFHGLIELVVIGTLRENTFSLKKILKARTDLLVKTGKTYPFATNNVKDRLRVSGRDIVFEFNDGSKVTLDGSSQINIDFITQFFRDIVFDVDGVAQRLLPEKGKGKIVIDPREGGGKPSVMGKEIWVDLITNIYTGKNSINMIKSQYNLEEDEILAAVEFSQ